MNAIRPYEPNYSYILKQMAELSRYETAMDRALQRARYDFERHQARCQGEDVAAPIAITVSGTLDVEDQARPPQDSPREPVEGRNPPSPVPGSGDSCRPGSNLVGVRPPPKRLKTFCETNPMCAGRPARSSG